ncbi:hypothetical protein BRARA_I03605 [Brassica rapa]|uniref:Uncharacterized protein n=1 Tax=Brassica campestris TaxID=3711 RepID=A0A397Y001_BRACM|nr:hypothetical protein BRARA_I03605 [Brassica rapa]
MVLRLPFLRLATICLMIFLFSPPLIFPENHILMSLVRSCTDGEACGRNNHTRFFSSKVSWWLLILGLGEEANQSRVSIEMKEKIDVNKNVHTLKKLNIQKFTHFNI